MVFLGLAAKTENRHHADRACFRGNNCSICKLAKPAFTLIKTLTEMDSCQRFYYYFPLRFQFQHLFKNGVIFFLHLFQMA